MPGPFNKRHLGINLLTLLAFVALWIVVAAFIETQRDAQAQLLIESAISQFSEAVVPPVRRSVDSLHTVSNVMALFPGITLDQFRILNRQRIAEGPGLTLLEWQPQVAGKQRDAFEHRVRSQGFPDFHLWQPDAQGHPVVASKRAMHYPVLFMLSEDGNSNTLGLDLAWSDERMASKLRARDSGRPLASDLFRIVTNKMPDPSPLGFAVTLPVYRDALVPETGLERRNNLIGFVAGVYELRRLLAPQLAKLAADGFNLAISSETGGDKRFTQTVGEPSSYTRSRRLDVYGSTWIVELNMTQAQASLRQGHYDLLLPVLIATLALFVLAFLLLLQFKNRQLDRSRQDLSDALHRVRESETYLRELSRHDSLTGLMNRRAFMQTLDAEMLRLERYAVETAVLMIDLDHFKAVNDRWGHAVGDEALRRFASTCLEISRNIDSVARLGGEEFAILLPHTGRTDAIRFAERLRRQVELMRLPETATDPSFGITTSIGIATTVKGISGGELLAHADTALYAAKRLGRNRVELEN